MGEGIVQSKEFKATEVECNRNFQKAETSYWDLLSFDQTAVQDQNRKRKERLGYLIVASGYSKLLMGPS